MSDAYRGPIFNAQAPFANAPVHQPSYGSAQPQRMQHAANGSSDARIASLKQSLEALENRIAAPTAAQTNMGFIPPQPSMVQPPFASPHPQGAAHSAPPMPQDALDDIEAAAQQIAHRQARLRQKNAARQHAHRLAAQQMQQPAPAPRAPHAQQPQSQPVQAAPRPAPQPVSPPPARDMETLKGIEAIGRHLGELKRDLHSLAEKGDDRSDQQAIAQLSAELDELRDMMRKDVRKVIRQEMEENRAEDEGGQSRLDARLDELTRDLRSLSEHAAADVSPRVDHMAGQLDAMRMTIEDLPQTLAITRLETRLNDMVERMEMIDAGVQQTLAQPAPQPHPESQHHTDDGEPAYIASLEARMDEIARALVAVSNASARAPRDTSATDRIEARMADLARAIDSVAADTTANHAGDELNQLTTRIEGLTERLGSFEKYAERGDLGGANAMFASPDTGVIEEQLRLLAERVEHTAGHAETEAWAQSLETQIASLYSRVEEASNQQSSNDQLAALEAQVAQILHHVEQPAAPLGAEAFTGPIEANVDLSPLENRLGNIENQLVYVQQATMDAAQTAAEQAVSMMGPQSEQGQIINALADDLRSLQAMAETGNERTQQSALTVQETLEQLVDRLASIEGTLEQTGYDNAAYAQASAPQPAVNHAHTMQALAQSVASAPLTHDAIMANHADETMFAADTLMEAAERQTGIDEDAGFEHGPIHQAAMQTGFVDAPSIDPADDMEAGYADDPEHDLPLEPGSQAPDVEALVRQATEKLRNATKERDRDDAAGSIEVDPTVSVVAAARRAVKQAEAELGNKTDDEDATSKASILTTLKARLSALGSSASFGDSKLKKPIMLAIAVVLLSVIGMKTYDAVLGDVKPVRQIAATKNTATKQLAPAKPATQNATRAVVQPAKAGDTKKTVTSFTVPLETVDNSAAPKQRVRTIGADGATVEDTALASAGAAPSVSDAAVPASPAAPAASAETTAPVAVAPSTARYDVPRGAGPKALVDAASAGDEKALFQLGMRYSEGNGVSRDMAKASTWFEAAAKQGFAPAQYSLGSLFEKGIGVERDIDVAMDWYAKAAAQGNARAMHNLAVIHAMGNPPARQPDMDKAVTWFKQAAALGIKDSQFNLGILYGQGMGVPQNLTDSYKWFSLAAKTGDSDASTKRDEVANAMAPEDLDKARSIVAKWSPKPLDEAVNRITVPKEWRGSAEKSAAAPDGRGAVKQAQSLLNQRGYVVGTPDGLIGPRTRKAIREFQKSAGLKVTGTVDRTLLKALAI